MRDGGGREETHESRVVPPYDATVLVGLVRVTEDALAVKEQHELLDPICSLVLEEQASRSRLVENRPGLLLALQQLSPGDRLVVTSARELGPSYVDGWAVMVQLAELGVPLRVLSGTDAGDYNHLSELRELIREI